MSAANSNPNTNRPGLVSRPSSVATMSKKLILVTGGNTGIGYETVKALAKNPTYQILMGTRDTGKGESAAAQMGAPVNVNPIKLDITDDESIEHCVKTIEQLFGRLDILINNAGTAGEDLKRAGQNPSNRQTWDHVFNVNVVSTAVFTDAVIPLLKRSASPKIIFVSSICGSIGNVQTAKGIYEGLEYNSSKAAVNMMAAFYARTLPEFKVNATCPGYRATGLNGADLNDETDPALGAVNALRLVDEGPEGATGTFTRSKEEALPW